MSADFEASKECYQFFLEKTTWVQMRDMACPKLVSTGLIASQGYAYVLGGSVDQICERFDPERDLWTTMPTYKKYVGVANGLFSYAICLAR